MTTTVRIAVPAGQGKGVLVRYGTQNAVIPVGGVQTFYVYDGVQASINVLELGDETAVPSGTPAQSVPSEAQPTADSTAEPSAVQKLVAQLAEAVHVHTDGAV